MNGFDRFPIARSLAKVLPGRTSETFEKAIRTLQRSSRLGGYDGLET